MRQPLEGIDAAILDRSRARRALRQRQASDAPTLRLCLIEQEGSGHALPRFALLRFYGLRGTHVATGHVSYLG